VHTLAAVTHIGRAGDRQDTVAKSGKANELTHFRPLLEPPLEPAWAVIGEMPGLLPATRVNLRMGGLRWAGP
jgi:hypothetical protein